MFKVKIEDGKGQATQVMHFADPEIAGDFAGWLREKLRPANFPVRRVANDNQILIASDPRAFALDG